jgi:hypothetical protein
MCKSGSPDNMASFRPAIVHGLQLHCTRPPDSREALPAEQWGGQLRSVVVRMRRVAARGTCARSQEAGLTSHPHC